jgi:hypothetical protein
MNRPLTPFLPASLCTGCPESGQSRFEPELGFPSAHTRNPGSLNGLTLITIASEHGTHIAQCMGGEFGATPGLRSPIG